MAVTMRGSPRSTALGRAALMAVLATGCGAGDPQSVTHPPSLVAPYPGSPVAVAAAFLRRSRPGAARQQRRAGSWWTPRDLYAGSSATHGSPTRWKISRPRTAHARGPWPALPKHTRGPGYPGVEVRYTLSDQGGDIPQSMILIREDGEWRICGGIGAGHPPGEPPD